MNEKKPYIIFNMKLAGQLMIMGFVLKKMEQTTKEGSRRNVFFFNESEELVKEVENFKSKKLNFKA